MGQLCMDKTLDVGCPRQGFSEGKATIRSKVLPENADSRR